MTELMTVQGVMQLKPCADYPRERVEELWAGREIITAAEAAALDIPEKDRIWLLIRWPGVTQRQLVTFAADCAERVLPYYALEDTRPRNAIEAVRGEVVTDAILTEANQATYFSGVGRVALVAESALYTALTAVVHTTAWGQWYSAYLAADFAAESVPDHVRAKEREWQVARLLEIVSTNN